MPATEPTWRRVAGRMLRCDRRRVASPAWAVLAWLVAAGGFVLLGGGNLDVNRVEARLGLAASEGLGPIGQVMGGWDPTLWPGRILPCKLWALGEGGHASDAAVRWPDAMATLLLGLIVFRRLVSLRGPRAGVMASLALFGSLGLIDRGSGTGLDIMAGLCVLAALDRIVSRRSDLIAGIWTALAFLAGGWPPVLMVLLPIVILGRSGVRVSAGLIAPVVLAFGLWSVWVIRVVSAEAWGAALFLPVMSGASWSLAFGVFVLCLPWAPLALLAARPSMREGLPEASASYARDWLQVGLVALLAGMLIPGLAPTARLVLLTSLAINLALVLDLAWSDGLPPRAARALTRLALGLAVLGGALFIPIGFYVAVTIPYYRPVAVALAVIGLVLVCATPIWARAGRTRAVLVAVLILAGGLKLAHWGTYAPEWDYRLSQGPWGRAIGRWVPPSWPLYITHSWPEDLLFQTGRRIRQVPAPEVLSFRDRTRPLFILILPAEFDHWPKDAPPIIKVHEFEDERGDLRLLARTEGDLGLNGGTPTTVDRGD